MAFSFGSSAPKKHDDIESLFRDLTGKKIQNLYSHQADILRNYENTGIEKKNVALELPTGSGKTLVGLLIGEFRRIKYDEKILYLCPTKQLVNQVVEQAREKYGIKAIAFSGSKHDYSPSDKSLFLNGEAIGVTNYSSVFNVNPFFDPNTIIFDDAHASENYISSSWSVEIDRVQDINLYENVIDLIEPFLPDTIKYRIQNPSPDPIKDRGFIEILPYEIWHKIHKSIINLFNKIENDDNLYYKWIAIKNNLHACNLFFSWDQILIRPIIPPSGSNDAFNLAGHKVFMSATLGKGGDLERITGVDKIFKIATPKGWEKSGLGRRFFIIPNHGFDSKDCNRIADELLNKSKKSVIIIGSDSKSNEWRTHIESAFPDKEIFNAKSIENTKTEFIESDDAVILLSNRFDGIDFQDDEARLLILSDIPSHANLQERFLQSRASASIIFSDRNKTRLIQAIGRCNRNSNDYAAVLILGDRGLSDIFSIKEKRKLLHPELQAEIVFGIEQSRNSDIKNIIENYELFINQTDKWLDAERAIIRTRDTFEQTETQGEIQLASSVAFEVKYFNCLWNEDYVNAFEFGIKVIGKLEGGSELRGYRGFWFYLTSKAAWLEWKNSGNTIYESKSNEYYDKMLKTLRSLSFLRLFKNSQSMMNDNDLYENELYCNIENLDLYFQDFEISKSKKVDKKLDALRQNLEDSKQFEKAQVDLGLLLGFHSSKSEESGAPDPYWKSGDSLVIVFEDKIYQSDTKSISLSDIRQANSHKTWIEKNENIASNCKIIRVIVTNSGSVEDDAKIHCKDLYYWNLAHFIEFGNRIFLFIDELRNKYTGVGDIGFRKLIEEKMTQFELRPNDIINRLKPMSDIF